MDLDKKIILEHTKNLMTSKDYKDRMVAEYQQLLVRTQSLKKIIAEYHKDSLGFKTTCPIHLLEMQLLRMIEYLNILDMRAEIEEIELYDLWKGDKQYDYKSTIKSY